MKKISIQQIDFETLPTTPPLRYRPGSKVTYRATLRRVYLCSGNSISGSTSAADLLANRIPIRQQHFITPTPQSIAISFSDCEILEVGVGRLNKNLNCVLRRTRDCDPVQSNPTEPFDLGSHRVKARARLDFNAGSAML